MAMSDVAGADGKRSPQDGVNGEPVEDALGFGRDGAGRPVEIGQDSGQFAFADEDVRLPWLESDDDDDGYEAGNSGQLIALVLGGLAVVMLAVGGIWWFTHRAGEEAVVADGSVIEAPAQPYKEAPKDPGGKTFAGTGDSSFAVSEGQTRPARLGQEDVSAKAPLPTAPVAPATKAEETPATEPQPSGVGVQVGAYSSRASAEAGWTRLAGQYEALSGLNHRVVEGRADIGTVYRLQALAGDLAGAQDLCSRLKAAGLACQVKR